MNAAPSIAMTNDDGRFEFEEISAGKYILRVSKTGFVSTLFDLNRASSAYFDLRGGQRIDRGELRLPKAGVITGRVVDTYGDPASEIKVTAWRADYFGPGERRLASVRSVDTNDLGEYRLFGLTPGKYYVSAAVQGVAPTFHPGTSNSLDAQPVLVKVNEDTPGTNIPMQALQYTRVAGVVHDSSGRPARNVVVMVNPSRSDGAAYFSMNMAEADANGRFSIPAVPPGEYRVDVVAKAKLEILGNSGSTGDAWKVIAESASIPLTVTGERLEELSITLGAGARISGRVLIDGLPARPEVAAKLQVAAFPVIHTQGISASLQTVSAPVAPDGSFVVAGVHGSRLIRVLGLPGSTTVLQGVIALGGDVSDRGLEVGQGDVTGVEIRLTTSLSLVTGIVTDPSGKPVLDGLVIVYSDDQSHWTNLQNRRVTSARAAPADGRFSVSGLPAGGYLAVAVAALEPGRWADPDNLENLRAFATRFTLAEGEKRSLTLVRR